MSLLRRFELFIVLEISMLVSIVEPGNLPRPFNNSISAIFVFGDSTVDSGNNNYVALTPIKSNFPPYGIDFPGHVPTGRFSDGLLVPDFLVSYIGIKEYVPAYLDPTLKIEDLMTGVCFASAGSGFDPLTADISGVISVQKQLEYFKEYKMKLENAIGKENTTDLISKAMFLISAGTNDFVVNYYGARFRQITYDIPSYQQFLLQNVQQFIQGLREEGAGVMAVSGLPPIGCVPLVISFNGHIGDDRPCEDSKSTVAMDYNVKLINLLSSIQNSSFIVTYIDIYKPINEMIQNPSKFGFEKSKEGCCGSGEVETSYLCDPISHLCSDPSKYIFFDSVHPTQAAYQLLFQALRPTVDLFLMYFNK